MQQQVVAVGTTPGFLTLKISAKLLLKNTDAVKLQCIFLWKFHTSQEQFQI